MALPAGVHLQKPGAPSLGHTHGAQHAPLWPQPANRTPPHQLSPSRSQPVTAGDCGPRAAPLRCDPAGATQKRCFRRALRGRRRVRTPGIAARVGAAPGLARLWIQHPPTSGRQKPARAQPRAPYLVTEAAGHQQVWAGRAIAAHGLLAAGASERVRHVAQGVGPRGQQGLGGSARHGARCRFLPLPAPRAEAPHGSTRGPALAGWEPPLPPPPAGSSSCPLGCAFPRRAPRLRARARLGPSAPGPLLPARSATPPTPRGSTPAAPWPPGRGRESEGE